MTNRFLKKWNPVRDREMKDKFGRSRVWKHRIHFKYWITDSYIYIRCRSRPSKHDRWSENVFWSFIGSFGCSYWKVIVLTWWIMIIWILTCSYYREYVHIKLDWSNIRKIKKIIWGCPSSSTLWTMKKHLRGFVDFNFIHMSLRDSKNHINPIIIFRDDDRIIMYDTWSNIPLKNKNDK